MFKGVATEFNNPLHPLHRFHNIKPVVDDGKSMKHTLNDHKHTLPIHEIEHPELACSLTATYAWVPISAEHSSSSIDSNSPPTVSNDLTIFPSANNPNIRDGKVLSNDPNVN